MPNLQNLIEASLKKTSYIPYIAFIFALLASLLVAHIAFTPISEEVVGKLLAQYK